LTFCSPISSSKFKTLLEKIILNGLLSSACEFPSKKSCKSKPSEPVVVSSIGVGTKYIGKVTV
jgi:hypothetical protein